MRMILSLFLSTIAALSENELNDKVEEARSRWTEIRQHTQAMLQKVHEDMGANMKKLHEDTKRQNEKLAENMKNIESILAKDVEIKKSMSVQPSFLEESHFGKKSKAEEEASARTQALLKKLDDIVKGSTTGGASSLAEVNGEDPAITALKRAQEKMQNLQQMLHNKAISLQTN